MEDPCSSGRESWHARTSGLIWRCPGATGCMQSIRWWRDVPLPIPGLFSRLLCFLPCFVPSSCFPTSISCPLQLPSKCEKCRKCNFLQVKCLPCAFVSTRPPLHHRKIQLLRPWLRGRITNEYALSWQSGEVSCPILSSLNKALPLIKSHSVALSLFLFISPHPSIAGALWVTTAGAASQDRARTFAHCVAGRLQHACQCERKAEEGW